MKITEHRTKEILNWLDDKAADHTLLFEKMTLHRDAAALIRQLQAELQDAWHAGLDAGREQGRGKDHAHPSPSAPVDVDAHKATLASLVAAVSLLRRGGRSAAPSDVMFNMMLADYEKSIEASRVALAQQPAAVGVRDCRDTGSRTATSRARCRALTATGPRGTSPKRAQLSLRLAALIEPQEV